MKVALNAMATPFIYGLIGYVAPTIANWILNGRGSLDEGPFMAFIWIFLTVVILVSIGYPLNRMTASFFDKFLKR